MPTTRGFWLWTAATLMCLLWVSGCESECQIGGCSGEICIEPEDSDMATPCLWLDEFDCFKKATCARQSNDSCGWTDTPELRACLEAARKPK